jgi:transposase-like protein
MSKRARRFFSPEFKAQAVDLVRQSGKSVQQIAKDLDLTETCLREWVKGAGVPTPGVRPRAAKAPAAPGPSDELEALRREVKQLRMERAILKKAAAFFARETT